MTVWDSCHNSKCPFDNCQGVGQWIVAKYKISLFLGNAADLPKYIQKEHGASQEGERKDYIDTDDNMQLVGGEKIEPDTHTLIRSNRKDLDRFGGLRESLVGMKEGIPGVYSGFKRTEKRYSQLAKKGKLPLI